MSIVFSHSVGVVFAEDGTSPEDDATFSVLFPTTRYIQSEDPTLVAANADYLIVYDKTESALFVRGGGRMDSYEFPLNIENVEYIKAVGNTAFIYADESYYTVDLKDTSAKPVKRELTSPANANYFISDGTYLYAKNVFGSVSIYDENLELAEFTVEDENGTHTVSVDNHNNPDFAGKPVLAGHNGLLYFLTFSLGLPYFTIYDPIAQNEIVPETEIDIYVSEAYVGDNVVVAQVASSSSNQDEATALVGLDKSNGKTLFASNIIPDSFCVYADKLYTIEGKQIITYTLESSVKDGQTVFSGFGNSVTISMKGEDTFHLDNPSDIAKVGSEYAVADTNNKRIGFIGAAGIMTAINLDVAPLRVTSDTMGVYVLCDDGSIVKIENNEIVQTLNIQHTVDTVDITYLDKLYLLKDDGIYTAIGTGIFKLADISGGRRIATAKDGSNIYVLKDDGISIFAKNGTALAELSADLTNVVDFSIDYAGKVFALRSNGFEVYENKLGTLSKIGTTEFYNRRYRVNASSLTLDGNKILFTANECFVGETKAQAATDKNNFVPSPYVPDITAGYHFAKLKDDTVSYIIPTDGRMEGITSAPTDTILVFDNDEGTSLAYALQGGSFFQIFKKDFDTVETHTLNGDYATIVSTALYALPGVNNGKITVDKDTRVKLFADCADFEQSVWTRVTYNDKVYFVASENIDAYINVIPEEDKTYGKAKAKRVGGLVNVFASASAESEIMTQIVDGTKIEVLEKLDGFYLVRYEDTVGYMQEHQVVLGGLTTVQIISIAIACLVAVAGVGVFIAIELAKKKAYNEERRKDKK